MKKLLLICLLLCSSTLFAQYTIDVGGTIVACEGVLTDSESGLEAPGYYDQNEDYSITICVPDAASILISFTKFSTEDDFDFLTIHAGTDLSGAVIAGPYSGLFIPPPVLINNSSGADSCFTVHFTSSENVTALGFELNWEAQLDLDPIFEGVFTIPNVGCFDQSLTMQLSDYIVCDAVTASAFNIIGQNAPAIAAATPINCQPNGTTNTVQLDFASPITSGGEYAVIFEYTYIDICGEEHPFTGNANFFVTDCPLEIVALDAPSFACGTCETVSLSVTGGNGDYQYQWQPNLGNVGTTTICPTTTTTYSVTVTDSSGSGQSTTTSFVVEVCPFEVSLDIAATDFCGDCQTLSADVSGGAEPYSYVWSVPAFAPAVGNVASTEVCLVQSGSYALTVTDAFGASTTATVALTACPLSVDLTAPAEACGACPNAYLDAVVSGGSTDLSYTWAPTQANQNYIDLCATGPAVYAVTVTDNLTGATATDDVFIAVCPLQVNLPAVSVCGSNCATIAADVPSGSGNYSYTWQPALPEGNSASGTVCLSNNTPLTYTVTVTDLSTSATATASTTVSICPLILNVYSPEIACDSACFILNTEIEGGVPPYSLSWSDPDLQGEDPLFCLTDTLNYPYNVLVTDALGNTDTHVGLILACPFIGQWLYRPTDPICNCDSLQVRVIGGSWNYSYNWDPPLPNTAGYHSICAYEPTIYSVTVTDNVYGSIWIGTTNVEVCPFGVNIDGEEAICAGETLTIEAHITGGTEPFSIAWSDPTLPLNNTGPFDIQPTANTQYIVTVTDGAGNVAIDTLWTTYLPNPTSANDIAACTNAPSINLLPLATPAGGTWSIDGIVLDAANVLPSDWSVGNHTLHYDLAGCTDSLVLELLPVANLQNTAACEGGSAFDLPPPDISGGTWAGSTWVQANGTFNPALAGNYVLNYTTTDNCSSTATVTVQPITLNASNTAAVCASPVTISYSPVGGVWQDNAAFDAANGIFYPTDAGEGIHTLYYTLAGNCTDSLTITVVAPQAAANSLSVCPQQGSIALAVGTPITAQWQAADPNQTGLQNPAGLYNPTTIGGDYTEQLWYAYDGCADTVEVSATQTYVTEPDGLEFCSYETAFDLSDIGQPAGGTWTGSGVTYNGVTPYFNPTTAGSGSHTLTYSMNACDAELPITVYFTYAGIDRELCDAAAPIVLTGAAPSGGLWSGQGITSAVNGIFNPTVSGEGTFDVVYTAQTGCVDSLQITVFGEQLANMVAIDSFFCLRDTVVVLSATPAGGVFAGAGVSLQGANYVFNPADAGTGGYLLSYTYGEGGCSSTDYVGVSVGSTLQAIVSPDTTICANTTFVLSAQGFSGSNYNYTYNWSNELGYGQTQIVSPSATTSYIVTVSDGCSEPVVRTVTLNVAEPLQYSLQTSETLCYGETGFATVVLPPNAPYALDWEHDPNNNSATISASTGYYDLTITDTLTQCSIDTEVYIPQYPLLVANFEPNPNSVDCIGSLELSFIDYSLGGSTGYWDFGDGTNLPYGQYPRHYYDAAGEYTVQLTLQNEGNCTAQYSQTLCIELLNDFALPTAFSPNNDGYNDVYRAFGYGIKTFEMLIYNRWGEQVFATADLSKGWDGKYGKYDCEIGAYVYQVNYTTVGQPEKANILRGSLMLVR